MININISEKISQYAVQAMLYEVNASPKPGLVDRYNSGAHKDMDIFTFMSSSAALSHYFYQCSYETLTFLEKAELGDKLYQNIFMQLRELGLEAEKKMYEATKGVNTHKGLIFSLGLIASAASIVYFKTSKTDIDISMVCNEIKRLTCGICEKDFNKINTKETLTAGEKLFVQHGIKGIRGEVEAGFPSVTNVAFPVLCDCMQHTRYPKNDILVNVLLHLMAITVDTNVLARQNLNTLNEVKKQAKIALDLGGMFTAVGKSFVEQMDRNFIKQNISPGGSADLLAVTIMLYLLRYNCI